MQTYNSIKPHKLKPGDTVAIISPSNVIAGWTDKLEVARKNFEYATGLKTVLSPNALASHYYSAGTKQQRIDDFHWALANTDIKAIIFSVGGNTAIELLESLDYELIKKTRKIIAGISDATTLVNAITTKTNLITFLGIEFFDYADQDMRYETKSIMKSWFDGNVGEVLPNANWKDFDDLPTQYQRWVSIKPGNARGVIVGGNYNGVMQLRGTQYMQDFKDKILFLEGYKNNKKEIHQRLEQLKLWGVLNQVSAIVIGYFVNSDDPKLIGNERPIKDIVLEATVGYNIPIMQIGEVGHNVENFMLPVGALASIDTQKLQIHILENVVE